MAWLIHELTHAWQYQHVGIVYLSEALYIQIAKGNTAYDYCWIVDLENAKIAGMGFQDFNPEQQGNITRDYY